MTTHSTRARDESHLNPFQPAGRKIAAVAAIVLVLVAAPAVAQADGQGEARPIVNEAVSQYTLGHYADAAALFERAYQLDPAPVLLFDLGQCHRKLGNHDLALLFYRRYLELAPPNARERPDVNERIADLEGTIRREAELKDKPPPGLGGDASRKAQPLSPEPSAPPSPPRTAAQVTRPLNGSTPPAGGIRTAAWTVGGLAAAALIVGGAEALVWSSRAARFNDHVGGSATDPTAAFKNCGADEANHGGPGCAALYQDMSTARALSIVGMASGGVLAIGAAILFVTTTAPSKGRGIASSGVGCAVNPLTASVACRLSF